MNKTIRLIDYLNPKDEDSLSGRELGLRVQQASNIMELVENNEIIDFIIPKTVENINPSYFLGLFGSVIRRLGDEEFRKKVNIIFENNDIDVIESLNDDISEGIRRAIKEKGLI